MEKQNRLLHTFIHRTPAITDRQKQSEAALLAVRVDGVVYARHGRFREERSEGLERSVRRAEGERDQRERQPRVQSYELSLSRT
ncbi:MAG: hypothetical protein R6U40_00765 [Desulfobacterales bacterium]